MRPGHESRTAVMVCMARAVAHGRTHVAAFADPTALALLPDDARQTVERFRAGVRPRSFRGRAGFAFLERRSHMMIARTVAIDEAIRAAAHPQLVILGAGLDGRAWRMEELAGTTVFEVDHPDSQREKRARAAKLARCAKEIRFVPVDFAKDRLDDALASAGHDPARPTTWVWEGVVMYLERADVEATLRAIARRSAPGSRLVVSYARPSLRFRAIGLFLLRVGEPFRSAFTAKEMRALLGAHGFVVKRDDDLPTIAAGLSRDLARATKVTAHVRVAIADRG